MPAVIQPPKDNRYYSLDIWRGVACIMVILYHAIIHLTNPIPKDQLSPIEKVLFSVFGRMDCGVTIFFVISGYCITAACDNLRSRDHSGLEFFKRRFRRIFPPFWIALLITLLGVLLLKSCNYFFILSDGISAVPDPSKLTISQWLGNLTLTETWRLTVIGQPEPRFDRVFMSHSWTLCYEEQFYAISGLALFISKKWFFRVMILITALVALIAFNSHRLPIALNGLFIDGGWLLFAAGVGVYWRVNYGLAHVRMQYVIDAIMFAVILKTLVDRSTPYLQLWENTSIAAFTSLLFIHLKRFDKLLYESRLLSFFLYCGIMCYSLYLIHWPLVKIITWGTQELGIVSLYARIAITGPISLAICIAVGRIFHVYVEKRFLNTNTKHLGRTS